MFIEVESILRRQIKVNVRHIFISLLLYLVIGCFYFFIFLFFGEIKAGKFNVNFFVG